MQKVHSFVRATPEVRASRLKRVLRLADPLLALAFNRIGNPALAGLREVLCRSLPAAAEAAA